MNARLTFIESFFESNDAVVFGVDREALEELQSLVLRLASGARDQMQVDALPFVELIGRVQLSIAQSDESHWDIGLTTRPDERMFVWTDSREGWCETAEKLNAMVASRRPCHQYFCADSLRGITIVVSRDEYDDNWWNGLSQAII